MRSAMGFVLRNFKTYVLGPSVTALAHRCDSDVETSPVGGIFPLLYIQPWYITNQGVKDAGGATPATCTL